MNCDTPLPPTQYLCPRARNAWLKIWRANTGGPLRFGPDAREWLAEQLGLDPADERLPAIAVQLAKVRKLAVCVDGEKLIGVAKPPKPGGKKERRSAA